MIPVEYLCPICEGEVFAPLHNTRGGYTAFNRIKSLFLICDNCGLTFRYPRPANSDILDGFYALEYWQEREISCDELFRRGRRLDVLVAEISESCPGTFDGKTILDVGCGFGAMVATLAAKFPNSRVVGVEPDRSLAKRLNSCNKIGNIEILNGSLRSLPKALRPDVVFLMTVFEHLLEPLEALQLLYQRLSSGGLLVINVPDIMEPGILGLDYFFRDFHLFYYSEHTLTAILSKAGFQVATVYRGGAFSNATAPTLCIVARKSDERRVILTEGEAARIKLRIDTVRHRTWILGPANYVYRYKLKRPLRNVASLIKRSIGDWRKQALA